MRRNVIAGAVAGVFVVGAAIGVPVAVNASNAAHAQEVAQIQAAKDGSVVVRADGARDAVLAGSAVQAGVIAQQEAAAKAAAAAAAQAAAAAAAQKAAQEAAAQQAAQTQTVQASSSAQQPVLCPAGSQANSGTTINGVRVDTSCFPDICFHLVLPDPAHPECVTAFKP